MTTRRLLTVVLALVAALAATGCEKEDVRTLAETEGLYLDVGNLKYQVQISRQLNAADEGDKAYLVGLPETTAGPTAQETWFAVFVRVQNVTKEPQQAARDFEIVDTQENSYRPLELGEDNLFAYRPGTIEPKRIYPDVQSLPRFGPTNGALLLFKLPVEALANRPLELKIRSSLPVSEGVVDLDV